MYHMTSLSEHDGNEGNGQDTENFFGLGMMVVYLRNIGKMVELREMLKMYVRASVTCLHILWGLSVVWSGSLLWVDSKQSFPQPRTGRALAAAGWDGIPCVCRGDSAHLEGWNHCHGHTEMSCCWWWPRCSTTSHTSSLSQKWEWIFWECACFTALMNQDRLMFSG